MFYWEAEKERGALYLYHHGLMAQVVLQKDGVREIHNASTEQHYTISYRQQGKSADAVVEVCFGICFDTSQRSHYYCGVIYNGKEIICVPKTDREKINQRIMSVDVTEQGTVEYDENGKPYRLDAVVLSTQHDDAVTQEQIHEDIKKYVFDPVLPAEMVDENTKFYINPTGRFVIGGPHGDSGLTGRKIIVDTYGGYARHGGGAFSGKDCPKRRLMCLLMRRVI